MAVFTVTGCLCWCSLAGLVCFLVAEERSVRREEARRQAAVVADVEAFLRDSAAGR